MDNVKLLKKWCPILGYASSFFPPIPEERRLEIANLLESWEIRLITEFGNVKCIKDLAPFTISHIRWTLKDIEYEIVDNVYIVKNVAPHIAELPRWYYTDHNYTYEIKNGNAYFPL